jgi:hypothetical protein
MNETDVKYLAGLLDADGHVGFDFTENRPYLCIRLTAADSIDRDGFVKNLPNTTGFGTSCVKTKRENWASITVWTVSRARDLEMLVPRLVKHMVIKGRHLQRMFDKWQELRGKTLSDLEREQLVLLTKLSRQDAGPLKAKKHPTWAWVAGYLDGDGSYIFSHPPSHKNPRMLVQATAHENDVVGLELLYKAFGGRIENRGKNSPHILDWRHSLGKRDKAFALKFLSKMVLHTRLKKHKIEQMIAYLNRSLRTCTD